MPSPFPGMDPYLESQGYWQDFHTTYLVHCRSALTAALPTHYGALIERHATTSNEDGPDGIRQRRIVILRIPDRSLVTVIETLCPPNKIGSGRIEYVEKRNRWIRQPVNLVEIDLLLRGHRLPMGLGLPAGDYFAFVARSSRRPYCDVYAWSVRRALPIIPIPLAEPDSDVDLNLGAVFAEAYDGAGYCNSINYIGPLELPLTPEDRAWAEELARARSKPPSIGT